MASIPSTEACVFKKIIVQKGDFFPPTTREH